MKTNIEKLKEIFGADSAIFALIHENEAPDAIVVIDGTTEVFIDTILNIILSESVDNNSISEHVWHILKSAMVNVIARSPRHAENWYLTLQALANEDKEAN